MSKMYFSFKIPLYVEDIKIEDKLRNIVKEIGYKILEENKYIFVYSFNEYEIFINKTTISVHINDMSKGIFNMMNMINNALSQYDLFRENLPEFIPRIYEFKVFTSKLFSNNVSEQLEVLEIDFEKHELSKKEWEDDATVVYTIYSQRKFF